MNDAELVQYITGNFAGIHTITAEGDTFFYYDPDPDVLHDDRFPFLTLVTSDRHDQASNLSRPGVYRLNIGISKQTFRSLFGAPQAPAADADDATATGEYDFAALDQVMPHPVYGRMYWVCVLNPGDTTFAEQVQPLLNEAHEMAVAKHARRAARR